MKKIAVMALGILLLFPSCQKSQKVKRYMQDGVEVIENGLRPSKIKGEPFRLHLEESLIIDMEREDIFKTGLSDPWTVVVDSEGSIYLAENWQKARYFVFKFSKDGRFISSFGRKGQGPGELQFITNLNINSQDQIVISDHMNRKYITFDKAGRLVRDIRFVGTDFSAYISSPLENEKYIVESEDIENISADYFTKKFSLVSPEGTEIKVLDIYKAPNPFKKGYRRIPANPVFFWQIANSRIYIANEDRGYEILIYDFDGKLLKKIRKEYSPQKVRISEETKKKIAKGYKERGMKTYVSKVWPAFQSFFTDDEGRLYVQTYEKDEKTGLYLYGIFNPEGIYVESKNLDILNMAVYVCAFARSNRLYCLQEKKNGYKQLVVYKMTWE